MSRFCPSRARVLRSPLCSIVDLIGEAIQFFSLIVHSHSALSSEILFLRKQLALRRECLDFMIPLDAAHLRRILKEWGRHYNQGRPHLSLTPGIPEHVMAEVHPHPRGERSRSNEYRVASRGILGGLHHEYRWERIAA